MIPRHEENLDWDFTELKIRVNSAENINRLTEVISKKINALKSGVVLESDSVSKNKHIININILGLQTHRLVLASRFNKEQEAPGLPQSCNYYR